MTEHSIFYYPYASFKKEQELHPKAVATQALNLMLNTRKTIAFMLNTGMLIIFCLWVKRS